VLTTTATRVCRVAVDVLAVERLFDYTVPEPLAPTVGVGTIVRVNLGGRRVRAWVVDDDVVPEAAPEKLRPLVAAVSAGPSAEVVALTAWAARRFAGPRLPLLRAASPAALVPPGPAPAPAPGRRSPPPGAGVPAIGAAGPGREDAGHPPAPPAGTPAAGDPAGDLSGAPAAAGRPGDLAGVSAAGGRPGDLAGAPAAGDLAADARGRALAVVRWPPAADTGDLLAGLVAGYGSTIVVVPDGRLGALAARLRAAGATVVPWLTEGRPRDRARAWDRCRWGSCLVLGGRSAVLAPVPDLAAVVIVDDGSEALKEERSPTWHARDLAAERVRRLAAGHVPAGPAARTAAAGDPPAGPAARLTIVSPVPPLEAPGPLLIPARTAERAGWPITEVIDRRNEPPGLGLFSPRAVAALRAAAEPERNTPAYGGQTAPASAPGRRAGPASSPDRPVRAICVLNRKGRARLLACAACGELARCERCDAAVSELDTAGDTPVLGCARCGATRPRVCVRCGSTKLKVLRSGVGKVRDEVAALLPGVGVAMVDAGTGELPAEPVLIGTEAVLHRVAPHPAGATAVVVFLDFDAELLAPRFRAAEQALWLLVRAARLVGPRGAGGRLLVQTRLPRHEVLEAAVRADPGLLADAERPRRKLLDLPPYAALARLTGDPAALAAASAALRAGRGHRAVGISGGGGDVLVRAPDHDTLAGALAGALAAGRAAGRIRAEVDPLRV